jgi:hypothetical protein
VRSLGQIAQMASENDPLINTAIDILSKVFYPLFVYSSLFLLLLPSPHSLYLLSFARSAYLSLTKQYRC